MDRLGYTINELCQSVGVSRATIYRELGKGNLKARKQGGRTIFLREDVLDWLSRLPEYQANSAA